jgi:hypothetical protein
MACPTAPPTESPTASPTATPTSSPSPPAVSQLGVDDSEPDQGQRVEVSGEGFLPNDSVDITIESTPRRLATVTTDATGSFSSVVTIPTDIDEGSHTLKATGTGANDEDLVLSAAIDVQQGQELPRNGAAFTVTFTAVGSVLIAAGLVLEDFARRRLPSTL